MYGAISFYRLFSILIVLALISSCSKPYTRKKELPPVVVEVCEPIPYSTNVYDIGAEYADSKGDFWKLVNVETVNSSSQEWQLLAIPETTSYLTSSSPNKNQSIAVYNAQSPSIFAKKVNRFKTFDMLNYGLPFFVGDQMYGSGSHSKEHREEPMLSYLAMMVEGDGNPLPAAISRGFEVEGDFWVGQFCKGPGDYIFFASDAAGGHGGTDLYYGRLIGDRVETARNLGKQVNTYCNELSPYYDEASGTLYFSSGGHENAGGMDIFKSKVVIEGSEISVLKPENIGLPLNSEHDEMFPTIANGFGQWGDVLYFSSNRPGGKGGFDIYAFYRSNIDYQTELLDVTQEVDTEEPLEEIRQEPKKDITKLPIIKSDTLVSVVDTLALVLNGRVIDDIGNKVIKADLLVKYPDGETISKTESNSEGGFTLPIEVYKDFEVSAQSSGKMYETKRVSIEDVADGDTVTTVMTLPAYISLRINFPNDEAEDPYPNVLDTLGNETNKTWQESIKELAEHIERYRSDIRVIEITGHTDTKGSDVYNKDLGRRRAEFVKRELVKLGVDPSILKTDSFGESMTLPKLAGEDLEQYERRLRRVEIKKIVR